MLDAAALEQYERDGYIVLTDAFPDLAGLTRDFVRAYRQVREPAPVEDGKGNKFRTRAQVPGSYWSALDHSLPALRIVLHERVVELGRQLLGERDIYLRNGGVNEMAPGIAVGWHRDSAGYFHAGEETWSEFMHYPFADGKGCGPSRGCLRVIPGSHTWDEQRVAAFTEQTEGLRVAAGLPAAYADRRDTDIEPTVSGEVSVSLGPADLLIRRGSIYHCAHANTTDDGRLMQHWLFRSHDHAPNNHRFRWEDYLSEDLIERLSPAQHEVLWLGRGQELDGRFDAEREAELGVVKWGTIDAEPALAVGAGGGPRL